MKTRKSGLNGGISKDTSTPHKSGKNEEEEEEEELKRLTNN